MMTGMVDAALASMLNQVAPWLKTTLDRIKPLIDQPVIRMPFNMPLSASNGQTIGAGLTNVPLLASDFSHAMEWPFEVHSVLFSQDVSHTFRDWRIQIRDQIFGQDFMKASAMVSTLVDHNTGVWKLQYPWIVRPKGGALNPFVDNLDTVNPITVTINFQGFLLIPR